MCSWHCKMAITLCRAWRMQMELRRQNDIAGRLEGHKGLPFVKHGHVIDSAVSFHKCVHFWDCTIFAMGCSYFSFLPYLVGIDLKLCFTWEWVIVLMWVYTEIIVFLTMHSHTICTLVLMDFFELWWLISKYFCTVLNISVICPNYFEQSYILVTLEPL